MEMGLTGPILIWFISIHLQYIRFFQLFLRYKWTAKPMKRILYIIGIIIFFLPSVVKAQYISADPATGVISACVGTASSSPNIQQITVSGGLLSSDVVVTAPNNFEVSLAGTGGFGNSITLPSTGGGGFFWWLHRFRVFGCFGSGREYFGVCYANFRRCNQKGTGKRYSDCSAGGKRYIQPNQIKRYGHSAYKFYRNSQSL